MTSHGLFYIWAVRNLATGEFYVLESLEKDVYTAVRLADWVTEDQIRSIAAGKIQTSILQQALAAQAMNDRLKDRHSQVGAFSMEPQVQPSPPKQPKLKRGALARTAILKKADSPLPDAASTSTLTGHNQLESDGSETRDIPLVEDTALMHHNNPLINEIISAPHLGNQAQLSTPGDPSNDTQSELDTVHVRYLETLYTSKASVAYFAKGPLARARAAFSSNAEPTRDRMDLAQFYRDSLLPLRKMDTKYKESLLKRVQDSREGSASKPRKARKRKQKIGKDGMYPDETDFVQRWWSSTSDGSAESSSDAEVQRFRALSTDLQSRETQMQILIILETMILETLSASPIKEEPTESGIQDVPTKKKQDLKTHLDLLVDKLCIWHTISFDDFDPDKAPGKKPNDKLRDFCSAVIIPFYASKLPVQCKALSKKLGGPSDRSPKRVRAPLTKSSSASKVLPGMELKRPRPQSSLQRALTEDFSRSRSPSVSLLSREPSERPVSRAGMQSRVLQNREVDLVAVAKQQETKLKRQRSLVEQKKELDAAISMLRKPNRDVVAKIIVDEAEQRHDGPLSKSSKRSVKPIQVMATPRKKKSGAFQIGDHWEESVAAPEITAIPSSTIKPVLPSTSVMSSRRIEETPSRGLNANLQSAGSPISITYTTFQSTTVLDPYQTFATVTTSAIIHRINSNHLTNIAGHSSTSNIYWSKPGSSANI